MRKTLGRHLLGVLPLLVIIGLFATIVVNEELLEGLLKAVFPDAQQHLYPRAGLGTLLREHLVLVLVSSVAATFVGVALGVFVTHPVGRDFLSVVQDISSLAQTFPPVAVLALAVPALGFGFQPTVVALFIYSILPVLNNTISGMEAIPSDLTEASRGIGMTKLQVLFLSELPLAARVIAAGVRTSVVINIGTATVGAVVGAGGLGVIIIAGLVRDNIAFVFSGAVTAALLALLVDWALSRLESIFYAPRARETR
ncbi:MAG: ABC transporter permease [Spirochaetaceae bacterium]